MALRIKEGIKLEELEKYGLKAKHSPIRSYNRWEYEKCDNKRTEVALYIFESDRKIINIDADDTLYDLIQAGIVVKE